jgi:predicted ATPase/DNA-binding winged helix-turn-helix (wHTH) protein
LPVRFVFHDVEVDVATRRVRVAGETVALEPQVFDVLTFLVRHRDRVVGKPELLTEVWGSRFVSDSALTSRVKSARAVVGDNGREQHTIRTVHGRGYQFVAPVEERPPGDARAGPARPAGAPMRQDGFYGRDSELVELRELVGRCRFVSIVGPGGTGKTRLSLELARGPAPWPWTFVDLAEVRDADALGQALVLALGIEAQSADAVGAACAYLRGERRLLVVDNCEHVLAAAGRLVRRVLDETDDTHVLATSRTPVGLRTEQVYRLQPLPVPEEPASAGPGTATNPAVALFLDRARRSGREIRLDAHSAADIAALCRAMDGLPLALELAAARAGTFGLPDLLARLDRRLDLLGDDRADTSPRHRSLRTALEWSFEQLDPACRRLFDHLSVFPAGLTLEGLEWLVERLSLDVRGEIWAALDRLVAASLVTRVEYPSGTRYVQLETMRAFGAERLAADEHARSARDAQAEWVLAVLAELARSVRSDREWHWCDRIRRELPNIRVARRRLREEGRFTELLQVSADLYDWAQLRDVSEIWTWADELADVELDARGRVRALTLAAQAAWRRGQVGRTEELANLALRRAGDDVWAASRAGLSLGVAKVFQGDHAAATAAWIAAHALDGDLISGANAAMATAYGGDVERARALAAAMHRQAVEAGWPTAVAWSSYVCGEVEAVVGDSSARAWLERAASRAAAIGSSFTYGVASVTLCSLMVAEGDLDAAARTYQDLITHWLRSGGWTLLWTTVRNAVALLSGSDPALALLAIDLADDDPLAAELDTEARAAFDDLRRRLIAALDEREVRRVGVERRLTDRVELATRVRAALAAR